MNHQHHYGAFRNFEGWEVWLYDGTTRIDRERGGFRSERDARRYANRLNNALVPEFGNGAACTNCGDEWAKLDEKGLCPDCREVWEEGRANGCETPESVIH